MQNLLLLAMMGSCAALAGQVVLRLSDGTGWSHQLDLPSLLIATMMVSGQRRVVFALGAFLLACLAWPSARAWWSQRTQQRGAQHRAPSNSKNETA